MKRIYTLPLLAFALLLLPPAASSAPQAQNWAEPALHGFVGGGVGYYRVEDEDFLDEDDDLDDDRFSWRVFAGAEFNRMFSAQVDYIDFGASDDGDARLDVDGWTISGAAAFPINEFFAPYAKVGQLFWDSDREFGPTTVSDDGNDFFWGLGARFTVTPNVDLRLEYERFEIDNTDLDMGSASIQFRF
ncbi:MAG: porin [Halomonadaceae bacterium]|nr:MAG: porin [Halomonadaceae bacterium]